MNTHHTEYSLRLITHNEILQFYARHSASKYWHEMYGCNSLCLHDSQHGSILLLFRMVPAIVTITYYYQLGVIVELTHFNNNLLLSIGSNCRTHSPTLKKRGFARRS